MKRFDSSKITLLTIALGVLPQLNSRGATLQAERVNVFNPSSPNWSAPSGSFVKMGEVAFFTAWDTTHGAELWRTDGTEAGTLLVKDIRPGSEDSSPALLVVAEDRLYFVADDGVSGRELWTSDGTEVGTRQVKDIYPGPSSSELAALTNVGRILFLRAHDGQSLGLWKSDGSESGTIRIVSGDASWEPNHYTFPIPNLSRQLLFFRGPGDELWKSDGTLQGTMIVKDIAPGEPGSGPIPFASVGETLYFWLGTGGLWKSDGTEAGTVLVHSGVSNPLSGTEVNFTPLNSANFGGILFFPDSNALWRSDGTETGTYLVKQMDPGRFLVFYSTSKNWLFQTAITPSAGVLFFTTISLDGLPNELWRSDGTASGTFRIKDLGYSQSSRPLVDLNGALFFAVFDDASRDGVVLKTDGTPEGTVPIDIQPRPDAMEFVEQAIALNGTILFTTLAPSRSSRELWKVRLGPWFEKLQVADGQLSGEIFDAKGGRFQVQGSTDLRTWTDLTVVTNVTGQAPFKVPATLQPAQFFRAIQIQP